MPVSNSDIDRFQSVSVIFEICFASSARAVFGFLFKSFCKSRRSVSTRRRLSRRRILAPREKPLFESFLCPFSAEVRVC